jgi:hypothetical protein
MLNLSASIEKCVSFKQSEGGIVQGGIHGNGLPLLARGVAHFAVKKLFAPTSDPAVDPLNIKPMLPIGARTRLEDVEEELISACFVCAAIESGPSKSSLPSTISMPKLVKVHRSLPSRR